MVSPSRDTLARQRARQLIAVVLLAALATLWCFLWLTVTIESISGMWLLLEVGTLVPLCFAARRATRLSARIDRMDFSVEDQQAEIQALRATHESIWRVGLLVSTLEAGPARDAAQEALDEANHAADLLRPLVRRRTQLEHLVEGSRPEAASAVLEATLSACYEDIDRLQNKIHDVGAAIASLVDAASDPVFEDELAGVRRSTDDVRALVAAFQDIEAIEGTRRIESSD